MQSEILQFDNYDVAIGKVFFASLLNFLSDALDKE